VASREDNVPIATERERTLGAVGVVANGGGLVDDMALRGSFRRAPSDPHMEANRGPGDLDVVARIVERMEDEITRKVGQRLMRDTAVATEVKKDTCGLKRRTIGFLLLFLVLTFGGVVGGAMYSIYGNDENNALPIPSTGSPSSTPIIPADDPLIEELKEWIIPTEQDLLPFSDPTSAQAQALEWLQSDPIAMSTNRTSETVLQRYILAVLYFATSGSTWTPDLSVGWSELSAEDVCTWSFGPYLDFGVNVVSCNGDGKTVDGIALYDMKLQGTLPWELVLLTNLEFLFLDYNRISGSIPSRINELTRLEVFRVSSNYLTGTLPPSFGSSVFVLWLDKNDFTGTVPGSWATEMPNLQDLDISGNALTGTLPSELGLLPLTTLMFHRNALTGSVDQAFCGGTVNQTLVADCDEMECPCCSICCYVDNDDRFYCTYP
jgi:hypothetical protein